MSSTKIWQTRIRRAEQLAAQYPFASEILSFYSHVAGFQERLLDQLSRPPFDSTPSNGAQISLNTTASKLPEVPVAFPKFLAMVEQHGPERTGQVARELSEAASESQSELLDSIWQDSSDPPSTAEGFLAFAFLQPYAELTRVRGQLQLANYTHASCPFCNRKAACGVLRPFGDGAQRRLICGFCLAEWEFRRIACPGCGEEDHMKLPVYTAETFPYIRVECCDACRTYIKSVDLSKNGLAEPLVDELASIPLNLWAQERGYGKLHPNLLGM